MDLLYKTFNSLCLVLKSDRPISQEGAAVDVWILLETNVNAVYALF